MVPAYFKVFFFLKTTGTGVPGGLAVKDRALSLLWHEFDPWPGKFCMPQAQPKHKTKQQQEKKTKPKPKQPQVPALNIFELLVGILSFSLTIPTDCVSFCMARNVSCFLCTPWTILLPRRPTEAFPHH